MILNSKLTQTQQELYDWLVHYIRDRRYAPSVREMMKAMGFNSSTPIQSCLKGLRKKGYVKWSKNKARSLQILRAEASSTEGIPVLGVITDGGLITPCINEKLDIPRVLQGDDHFALRVVDNGMTEDLIAEGDILVMEPVKDVKYAKSSKFMSAKIDGQGITIKNYQVQGSKVILSLANIAHKMTVNMEQVELQGALVGVWRCFNRVR
jgi:repressor LexA